MNKLIEDTVMSVAIKIVGVLLGSFSQGALTRATCDPDAPEEVASCNLAFRLLNQQQPGQWEVVTKRENGHLCLQHVEYGKDDCDPTPYDMNKLIDNEQAWDAWDAQIEADLKAGKLVALVEAARAGAEDAHAVKKPTGNKLFCGLANGGDANDLAQQIMDQANLGMATRMFSKPGDMNSVALLVLAYQVLEANSPGYWFLRPVENCGVCLVSANWEDDA